MNIKKIKPMFTKIVTTADKYEEDITNGALISKQKDTLKEYQKVVAVGTSVSGIKVGDLVSINPTRYAVHKRKDNSLVNDIEGGNPVLSYKFDFVLLNNVPHLLLESADVEYIIEDYTEDIIQVPNKEIIV